MIINTFWNFLNVLYIYLDILYLVIVVTLLPLIMILFGYLSGENNRQNLRNITQRKRRQWSNKVYNEYIPKINVFFLKLRRPKSILSILILVIIILLIDYYWSFMFFQFPSVENKRHTIATLSYLLTASSIIISFFIAFLISKYFDIQKFRYEKFNRFIKLQEELTRYQNAFYELCPLLKQKYELSLKYRLELGSGSGEYIKAKLRFYPKYNNYLDDIYRGCPSPKIYACILITAMNDFGAYYKNYVDFELNQKLMDMEYLKEKEESSSFLVGILDDSDWLREIFKDLNIDEDLVDRLNLVDIAEWINYEREFAFAISPESEKDSWKQLDFWVKRIEEAHEICIRMLNLSRWLHGYQAVLIKKMVIYLIIASVFGVIAPLILLNFSFSNDFLYYATYFSLVAFILIFIRVLFMIYMEVTSTEIMRL